MALVTPQNSVNVGKLYAVLQPPARGAGYELPAVSHKGFTALVSPATRVAAEHGPAMTDLSLTAGSETHAAHVKDLMFVSHKIPPWPTSPSPCFRTSNADFAVPGYDTTSWRIEQGKQTMI